MGSNVADEKQQVHELLDRLAPSQVAVVRGLLEAMLDPGANTAVDDERVTQEDQRRFREGETWFAERGGKGIPMEDVLSDFGLKPKDFPTVSEKSK